MEELLNRLPLVLTFTCIEDREKVLDYLYSNNFEFVGKARLNKHTETTLLLSNKEISKNKSWWINEELTTDLIIYTLLVDFSKYGEVISDTDFIYSFVSSKQMEYGKLCEAIKRLK